MLDTGCSRTLIHQSLVPEDKLLPGEAIAIRCAHGNTVLYPLAQVHLEVDGHTLNITAAVAERLPVSVLLGTDVPILTELLSDRLSTLRPVSDIENALVVTRAKAREQLDEMTQLEKEDLLSGAHTTQIETLHEGSPVRLPEAAPPTEGSQTAAAPEWMFDEELFFGGIEREFGLLGIRREKIRCSMQKDWSMRNSQSTH